MNTEMTDVPCYYARLTILDVVKPYLRGTDGFTIYGW